VTSTTTSAQNSSPSPTAAQVRRTLRSEIVIETDLV